jgi:dissimilatory sulfite reductase (desulfoviridin) alpha/beta subunit
MRTASDIEAEMTPLKERLATLTLELNKLKNECEHRLNAIHVHKHQQVAYKKCLACGHSVKMTLAEVYSELEGEI